MARPQPRRPVCPELVARGLAGDEDEAHDLVEEGIVTRNGGPVTSTTTRVAATDVLALARLPRFVSRAGEKLDHALEQFGLDVAGRRALDVGSSTGGFVDCLLQRGAAQVVAVDIGPSTLHPRMADDPRVDMRARTDGRTLTPATVGPFGLASIDASLTSLVPLLAAVARCLDPGADVVTLVKPQYEADIDEVRRTRGTIRDPAIWRSVLRDVAAAAAASGLTVRGLAVSPIKGRKGGNVEFLLHARLETESPVGWGDQVDIEALIDAAVVAAAT